MIPAAMIRDLLSYDPTTGVLTWRDRPRTFFKSERDWRAWNTAYAGKPALTAKHGAGYRHGCILREHVLAHRAAWAVMHGVWPREIDHINGDRADNRAINLREVSALENRRNSGMHARNKSGVCGVFLKPNGRWLANILVGGKTKYLGQFATREEATAARSAAERLLGYHPNHGQRPSHRPSAAEQGLDLQAARGGAEANNLPPRAA
jgi:hypothetical protein